MKNLLKKFLVALIITTMGFSQVSMVMAAKPSPSFTLIDSLIKSSKSTTDSGTTVWNYNGTTDGYCNDLTYDENAPAGKQQWLFILTSPAANSPYKLTAKFDESGITVDYADNNDDRKGKGAVHFTVDTAVGAKLESASAITGTRNSVLTVSHCIHGVKPLEVEKSADTSFTRTWDWEIDKRDKDVIEGDMTNLGDLTDEDTPKIVTYEIKLSAEDTDSDHVVSGTITIKNPADNPTATIDSIVDKLDVSGEVVVSCPESFDYQLDAEEDITCTYSHSYGDEDELDEHNTVTVDATIGGLDLQTVATADVDWSEADVTKIDECVDLTDTNPLFTEGGEVCASDPVKTFTYDVVFGVGEDVDVELTCGPQTYPNTATVLSLRLDEEEEPIILDQDTWTVTYNYICPVAQWCSPGYWRQEQHLNSWDATGISPDELYSAYFDFDPEPGPTLLEVLQSPQTYGGDAFNNVGDLLSTAHPGVNFQGERVEDSCPLN